MIDKHVSLNNFTLYLLACYGYLFPKFSKVVWFAPYKQIGIVFTLNNNNIYSPATK